MSPDTPESSPVTLERTQLPGQSLALVVVAEGFTETHALPLTGRLVMGRAPECDLVIPDPSISRRHAVLTLGPSITIEDLHSANGTAIRGVALEAGSAATIAPGDLIELGATSLLLQRRAPRGDALGSSLPTRSAAVSPMDAVLRLIDRIAASQVSVLILGETGVGKEVLAERIHRLSQRAAKPFVRLNCAALAESLLESELFGHERGAFTGAVQTKPGLLETAEGGTVFLDEVGELPLSTQVKLLRVLEARRVMRVGAVKERAIDVRFLAATNRDLDAEIQRGAFRQDLYFRLNGVAVEVPPLRTRLAELVTLAERFLAEAATTLERTRPGLSPAALRVMRHYRWPGNIRELRHVMERALLLCDGDTIAPEDLPIMSAVAAAGAAASSTPPPLATASADAARATPPADQTSGVPACAGGMVAEVRELERRRIVEALAQCAGNQKDAAALLGLSRRALITKIEAYGIPRPRKNNQPS